MSKVLVTGGAGFIGSHLCDELLAHDYEVRVLDSLDSQVHGRDAEVPEYLDKRVEFRHGEVTDIRDVRLALKGVDYVVHLAAKVGVGQSAYELNNYMFTNSYGTGMVLEQLDDYPVKRLIVASSMSVYGEGAVADDTGDDPHPVATDEHKPVDLQSVYALSKYDQERLCLLYGNAFNVPVVALRFFNVYGTRQSLNNPYTGIMAIFASRLLNDEPPIIFEDGMQRRDFVHVYDVVRGIRLALESSIEDEVINIGSGQNYTVLEIAQRLTAELGKDIAPVITGQHREGDIRHCFASIEKAQRLLDYKPMISLEMGIRELVKWLQTQPADDKLVGHVRELTEKGLLK